MFKKKKKKIEALHGALGEAFNFTQDDLEANRAGFISHRQKTLWGGKKRQILSQLVFWMTALGLMIALLLPIIRTHIPFVLWLATFILISSVSALPYALWQIAIHWREFLPRRVRKYQGKIKGHFADAPYYFLFDSYSFPVSEDAYRLIVRDGEREFTVYYLPKTSVILSIELLR